MNVDLEFQNKLKEIFKKDIDNIFGVINAAVGVLEDENIPSLFITNTVKYGVYFAQFSISDLSIKKTSEALHEASKINPFIKELIILTNKKIQDEN